MDRTNHKIYFTRDQVEAVVSEVHRRFLLDACESCSFDPDDEFAIFWSLRDMMQGVYSSFCVLASNWPEVASWLVVIERVYFPRNYN